MNDATTPNDKEMLTVGLDLGDKYTQLCVLDPDGQIVEEARLRTTPAALGRRFRQEPTARMVLEAGTHSPWVSRLLEECGHEVHVANPRRLRLIYQNDSKSDRVDAEYLARIGRLDPALLAPFRHRSADTQADLALVRSREVLVRTRTRLINHIRGAVKSRGGRLPKCSSATFATKVLPDLPAELQAVLAPLLEVIAVLDGQIGGYVQKIEEVAQKRYPERPFCARFPAWGPLPPSPTFSPWRTPPAFPGPERSAPTWAYVLARPTPGILARNCTSPKPGMRC